MLEFLLNIIEISNYKFAIQNFNNIASCAIWLRNVVSYIKGGMQVKGI